MTSLQQANIDEMREIASRICRDYLTGAWKTITAKDIKLKRISGGLSNFLYYVSLPDTNDSSSNDSNSDLTVIKVKSTEAKRVRKDSGGSSFCEPKEVLLRIYGQIHGENALETMLTESVVFTLLSERNLGPKLHGIFPGGRIEQYIPARALTTIELSDYKISMKIAEKMAEIHSLNIPVSKEPDWLWNSMNRWLHTIDSILNDFKLNDNNKQFQTQFNEIKSTNLKNEIKWIKSIIKMNNFPVVFCHNDLQEGNILLKEDSINTNNRSSSLSSSASSYTENNLSVLEDSGASSNSENNHHFSELRESESNGKLSNIINANTRKRSLRSEDIFCDLDNTRDSLLSGNSEHSDYNYVPDIIIIDYEYCAYNYRGFDLANHFIEWTVDYTTNDYPFFEHQKSQYPNKQQKHEFIETYLRKLNEFDYGYNIIDDDVVNNENDNIKKSDIKKVEEEIRVFTMVSHLFWCLWGIVNVHQAIEFGYWDYAVCRLRQYLQVKEEFITTKSNGGKK